MSVLDENCLALKRNCSSVLNILGLNLLNRRSPEAGSSLMRQNFKVKIFAILYSFFFFYGPQIVSGTSVRVSNSMQLEGGGVQGQKGISGSSCPNFFLIAKSDLLVITSSSWLRILNKERLC